MPSEKMKSPSEDYLFDSQIDSIHAEAVIGAKQGMRPWQIMEQLAKEVKRLRDRVRHFEMRDDAGLADSACSAIREVLEANGVPSAAFIEDHVGNLVWQRDMARNALADALREWELCLHFGESDLLTRIAELRTIHGIAVGNDPEGED